MSDHRWTVSSLVRYLKLKLDNDQMLQDVTVIGELSNFNHHHSGHMYFTLKDDKSRINCVMFKSYTSKVDFKPENGLEVILKANMSVFESSGAVQLYATEMIPYGMGNLALKFEQLKKKLSLEGLFDEKLKQTIPNYPKRIALVTGANTAAYQDLRTTLARRWPVTEVEVFNALVQGEKAHLDIIEKLEMADNSDVDVIILARGGGSIEDLWAFNEEELVRKISELKTPIISGVGHETDFTITDFVADLRAPTPTGAAELATPNIIEVHQGFLNYRKELFKAIRLQRDYSKQNIDTYRNHAVFQHPEIMIANSIQMHQMYQRELERWSRKITNQFVLYKQNKERLLNSGHIIYNREKTLLNRIETELMHHLDSCKINKKHHYQQLRTNFISKSLNESHRHLYMLTTSQTALINTLDNRLRYQKSRMQNQIELLDSYSPLKTLQRGYSITTKDSMSVNSIEGIEVNDIIITKVVDGCIESKVISKEKTNE